MFFFPLLFILFYFVFSHLLFANSSSLLNLIGWRLSVSNLLWLNNDSNGVVSFGLNKNNNNNKSYKFAPAEWDFLFYLNGSINGTQSNFSSIKSTIWMRLFAGQKATQLKGITETYLGTIKYSIIIKHPNPSQQFSMLTPVQVRSSSHDNWINDDSIIFLFAFCFVSLLGSSINCSYSVTFTLFLN